MGEWRDGLKEGSGVYKVVGKETFSGDFVAGRFVKGSVTLPDGSRYVGSFDVRQYRSGEGIEYGPDGRVTKSGVWSSNSLIAGVLLSTLDFPFRGRDPIADRIAVVEAERRRAEGERLRTEMEASRKRQQELDDQLARERERISSGPSSPSTQPVAPSPLTLRAHALVIGNAAYPGSARLDNPINDAEAISQKLRSMGFTVSTVTDANRQRLVRALSDFRRTAASADLSLLFYSGHGVQIFGTNYILPTDVDQSDPAQATIQGVSLNNVVESFLPGKTKLVFLDACRDNPLQRTSDRSVSKGLAPISAAQGTLIAYATKDGQTASDGPGQRNSPFTQALLQHLDEPSDIAVVLRKVREKVMQATGGKQQPWEYGSLTGGELVLSRIQAPRRP